MPEANPRAAIGDNTDAPDYALQETKRLSIDYGHLAITVDELADEAADMPTVIEDAETKGKVASLIKRIRDAAKRIEALRESEKLPFFRRGQGVDQFFNGLGDRLAKRDRKARDGAADILQRALTEYDNKLLLEEQARRRREAEEAARIERERQQAAAKAAAEAEERRLAAERARTPETREAKQGAALAAETASDQAQVEAAVAGAVAEEAYIGTLARPADIMRTRGSDGTLTTMAQEGYAEVSDPTKLDPAKLWPYIPLAAKETALRQWAKSVGYRQEMDGAAIGFRNRSVVR